MLPNQMKKRISTTLVMLALVLGVSIATSTTAQAQHRSDHPHPERDYGYGRGDIYQVAYDNGHHDGVEHGMEHRNEGKRSNYGSTQHYKEAIDGYNRSMGDKDDYKRAYREGFRRGYDEGYRGYNSQDSYDRGEPDYRRSSPDPYYREDPYNREDPYQRDDRGYGRYGEDVIRIARNNGYCDGVDHGAEHARDGHRYDYGETRHYKDGDSGYRSSYGSKDAYKQAYREGFRRGYDEGYRRYAERGGSSRSRFPFPRPF